MTTLGVRTVMWLAQGQLVILPGLRVPSRFLKSQTNHFPSVSQPCILLYFKHQLRDGSQFSGPQSPSPTTDTWRPCSRWQGSSYWTEYWQRLFCPLWSCVSSERALPSLAWASSEDEVGRGEGEEWKARERAEQGKEKNRWLIASRWELWLWWIFTVQRSNDFRNVFFWLYWALVGLFFKK